MTDEQILQEVQTRKREQIGVVEATLTGKSSSEKTKYQKLPKKQRKLITVKCQCKYCHAYTGAVFVNGDIYSENDVFWRTCDNIQCQRRQAWDNMTNTQKAKKAISIGVGKLYIRGGVLPTYADFITKVDCNAEVIEKSVFVCGPIGTGKTWMLNCLAVDSLSYGLTVRVLNWQRFQLEVQDTYRAAATETALDILKRYTGVGVLCIDDIGTGKEVAGKESEAARVLLYSLIDDRYVSGKTTHISSNMDPSQISARYDGRIGRRINEMCTRIYLTEEIKP